MKRKATGFGGTEGFTFPAYGGGELNPELKDGYTSLDGGHSSPTIGVKPHAEDMYAQDIGPDDLSNLQFPTGENVAEFANTNGLQSAVDRMQTEGVISSRQKEMVGEIAPLSEDERAAQWDWSKGKVAGMNETTLQLDAITLPAEANQNNNHSEETISNYDPNSQYDVINQEFLPGGIAENVNNQPGQQPQQVPGQLPQVPGQQEINIEDALSGDEDMNEAKWDAAWEELEKELREQDLIEGDDISRDEGHENKKANVNFDVIEASNIFIKRIPTLYSESLIEITPNELVGAEEAVEIGDEETERYTCKFTIPNISEIFSSILGYTVEIDEAIGESLLTDLMVNIEFENQLYLVFINSEQNKVFAEVSGTNVELPVGQEFFTVEKTEIENDMMFVDVEFSVQK